MKRHTTNTLLTRLMLLTSAVILIVAVIAASVSYANLHGEIKVANESYYQKRFENACGLLDQRFFQPVISVRSEIATLKNWKDTLAILSVPLSSQIPIKDTHTSLKQKLELESDLADIAVYSPQNAFIISALSGVSFLNSAAVTRPFDRDWVLQLQRMSASDVSLWLPARSFPQGIGVHGDVLSYVCKLNLSSSGGRIMYLCLSTPVEHFGDIVSLSAGEKLFLVDESGSTVLGDGNQPNKLGVSASPVLHDGFYCMKMPSAYSPWYYVMQIPAAIYTNSNSAFILRMVTAALLVLAVMVLISYIFIRRLTSPFSAMLEDARRLNTEKYEHQSGDMHFVAETFREHISASEALREQLLKHSSKLRRSFLLALLNGNTMSLEETDEYLEFLDINFKHTSFAALILYRIGSEFESLDELRIENMIERINSDELQLFSAGAYGQAMYYLVAFSDAIKTRETLESISTMLKSSVFEYDIKLSIGPSVDGIEQIEVSFRSALMGEPPSDALAVSDYTSSTDTGHAECARKAAEYLDAHYAHDVSVDEIADALGVSRSFLSRCFKEVHGMTILEYLLGVRMKKALGLLDETDLSINEISARVGFNNANYFFRKFKEEFGFTPTQYRTEKTRL